MATGDGPLKHGDRAQLAGLVQDLFVHSQENRVFLAEKLMKDSDGQEALIPHLKRIESAFNDKKDWPQNRLNLKDVRTAIREYQRTTSDPAVVNS